MQKRKPCWPCFDHASPVERALIGALTSRYPQSEPADDQSPWDRAFAEAMRGVQADHPARRDVKSVLAEAIMVLTPWKM